MNIFSMAQSVTLAGKIFDAKKATDPMIRYSSFKPAFLFGEARRSTRLEVATPESVGIPSAHIRAFIERIVSDRTLNMHDLLIIRNGKKIAEVTFGAERTDVWKHTFSACKSVVSLAIGMLIDDGLLTLDERVVPMFSEDVGTVAKIRLRDLCVEDLLTMRSSILFAEVDSATDANWKKAFFASATQGEIGETFRYNSLNTYVLSAIVTAKTGKSLSQFLDERLFSPLGIVDYYWEKSPEEIDKGGWGLYIHPEDIAKLGILVMNGGVYEGKRYISEEYLQKATALQAKVRDEECRFHYGYQIWVGNDTDSFLFNGMLGQNVLGFRRNGILLITHAGNNEFFHSSTYFGYAKDFFDRDFEETLSSNSLELCRLQRAIKSLSSYESKNRVRARKMRKVFSRLVGDYSVCSGDVASVGVMPLMLQMVQSEYTRGFEKLTLELCDGKPHLIYIENEATYDFALDFKKPTLQSFDFGENHFLVATSAALRQNEDELWVLSLRLDFVETPFTRLIKIIFDGDNILVKQSELPGESFVIDLSEDMLKEALEKPFVSTILDKVGDDYIKWKLKKVFAPEFTLSKNH